VSEAKRGLRDLRNVEKESIIFLETGRQGYEIWQGGGGAKMS
jgi:hypothetical protein